MDEKLRIKKYTKGEVPKDNKVLLRVFDISNPKNVLENFKKAVVVILENIDLDDEDKRWEKILPEKIVSYLKQLDKDDFSNDDLLDDIDMSVYSFQKLKRWTWFSSRLLENGFEIIFEGDFHPRFVNFIHCQNVPLANIWIKDDTSATPHNLKVYKDYTSYKTLK